jgi:heme oxygenase
MMDNRSSMSTQMPPHSGHRDQNGGSGLADFLRAHTQDLHVRAERSGIVWDLLKGQADRNGYAIYLRNILPAYRALEAGLDRNHSARGLELIARRDLYRAPALESDLRALRGDAWETSLPLLPAGERYRRRIANVADADPPRLIAYAYVRYLGDLNGGLILRKLLARSLELPDSALAFYEFPLIDDLPAAKRAYRAAFDLAGQEIGDPASIANEAAMAFHLNIGVSEAVHDLLTGAADATL